jgi:hypothetical protein
MAKETVKNSKGEQGRVLEATVPQPAVGEGVENPKPGKAKKDTNIAVAYFGKGEDGKPAQMTTPFGTRAIVVHLPSTGERVQINLAELSQDVLMAAAAMGLNTALRNAMNTTEHGGGDGTAAVKNRISALKNGLWAAQGTGGGDDGIPLVIEAMIRVKKDANLYTDGMENKWLDQYRALDKDGRVKQTAEWKKNKLISNAVLKITAERAAERANRAASGDAESDAAGF